MSDDERDIDIKARFAQGVGEFNHRLFFECHETLEEIWMNDPRPTDRLFFQGILQIAVGFHHLSGMNFKGARNLLVRGIEKTEKFRPKKYGVDVAAFVEQSNRCLDEIKRLGRENLAAFDESLIPRIELGDLGELEKEWAER